MKLAIEDLDVPAQRFRLRFEEDAIWILDEANASDMLK
jgi:hypothetical protein